MKASQIIIWCCWNALALCKSLEYIHIGVKRLNPTIKKIVTSISIHISYTFQMNGASSLTKFSLLCYSIENAISLSFNRGNHNSGQDSDTSSKILPWIIIVLNCIFKFLIVGFSLTTTFSYNLLYLLIGNLHSRKLKL
jgi:hypothetical protein